jgi:hypothetical protein
VRATNRAGPHRVRQYRHLHQRRGLTAVDHLCTTEAAAARLTGSFSALVATGTASAISRFDPSGANWVRRDGVALAGTVGDFAAGKLFVRRGAGGSVHRRCRH